MIRQEVIPMGACVDQSTAPLFDAPDERTQGMARQLCLTCVQFDNCQKQQVPLASVIATKENFRPIVAGENVTTLPMTHSVVKRFVEHGEPSFRFNFSPLPTDDVRGLTAIRQALRTGQLNVNGRSQIDKQRLYGDRVETENAEYSDLLAENPHLISRIGDMIIAGVVPRTSTGRIRRTRNWQPHATLGAYYPIVKRFLLEAEEIQALGFKPLRAIFHGPAFFKEYLNEGRKEGIPNSLLFVVANTTIADLLPRARSTHASKLQTDRQRRIRRTKRHLPESVAQSAEYSSAFLDLVRCNVLTVTEAGRIDFHETVRHFNTYERDAVLYALDVANIKKPTRNKSAVEKAVGKSCEDLTFSVLLPFMRPEIRVAATAPYIAALQPDMVLALVRRGLSTGLLPKDQKASGAAEYVKFKYAHDQVMHNSMRQPHLLKGLALLYKHTERLLAQNGESLDVQLFRQVARAYLRDTNSLRLHSQTLAPRMALYYSPQTHAAVAEYLATKPDLRTHHVNTSLSRCATPLKFANTYIETRQKILASLALDHGLSESTISTLAMRNMSVSAVNKFLNETRALQEQYRDIFGNQDVLSYCLRQPVSSQSAKNLAFKAAIVRQFYEDYGKHPAYKRAFQRTLLLAKQGTEARLIHAFLVEKGIPFKRKTTSDEAV